MPCLRYYNAFERADERSLKREMENLCHHKFEEIPCVGSVPINEYTALKKAKVEKKTIKFAHASYTRRKRSHLDPTAVKLIINRRRIIDVTANRGPVIFAKYNSRWCDGAGRGDAWSGTREDEGKTTSYRLVWWGTDGERKRKGTGARTHGGQEKRILNKREKNREGIPKETRRPCRG